MMISRLFLSAAILQLLLGSSPVLAVSPPLGMTLFCINYASQCETSSVAEVAMSDQVLAVLTQVNTSINESMRYAGETGMVDSWKVGGSAGDCEDYVLTKRAMLIRMGIPAGALRIATTQTRREEPHAVLVVRTSQGDYILDNIKREVMKASEAGYRIKAMSSANPLVWLSI